MHESLQAHVAHTGDRAEHVRGIEASLFDFLMLHRTSPLTRTSADRKRAPDLMAAERNRLL